MTDQPQITKLTPKAEEVFAGINRRLRRERVADKVFLSVMFPIIFVVLWATLRCVWGMAMGYQAPLTLGTLLWGQMS